MLEILQFIFSSFWVWSGTCILLAIVLSVVCSFITFLAELFRPRPASTSNCKPVSVVKPSDN